jgi:hypothetical protein
LLWNCCWPCPGLYEGNLWWPAVFLFVCVALSLRVVCGMINRIVIRNEIGVYYTSGWIIMENNWGKFLIFILCPNVVPEDFNVHVSLSTQRSICWCGTISKNGKTLRHHKISPFRNLNSRPLTFSGWLILTQFKYIGLWYPRRAEGKKESIKLYLWKTRTIWCCI